MTDQPLGQEEREPIVVARPVPFARPVEPLNDLELPSLSRSGALFGCAFVIVAAIVAPYAPTWFVSAGPATIDARDFTRVLIVDKWVQATLAILLMTFLALHHRLRPAAFGLRLQRPGVQAAWGLAALGGAYAALLVGTVIVVIILLLAPPTSQEIEQRIQFMDAMPISSVGAQIILLVAVAIEEEFVFRGMLIPLLHRLLGRWWAAALASSLLFAALHIPGQGLLAGLQVFFVAAALATFFIRSRSLLAVMIAHFCFDFLQFQLIRALPDLHQLSDALGK